MTLWCFCFLRKEFYKIHFSFIIIILIYFNIFSWVSWVAIAIPKLFNYFNQGGSDSYGKKQIGGLRAILPNIFSLSIIGQVPREIVYEMISHRRFIGGALGVILDGERRHAGQAEAELRCFHHEGLSGSHSDSGAGWPCPAPAPVPTLPGPETKADPARVGLWEKQLPVADDSSWRGIPGADSLQQLALVAALALKRGYGWCTPCPPHQAFGVYYLHFHLQRTKFFKQWLEHLSKTKERKQQHYLWRNIRGPSIQGILGKRG